MFWRSLVDHARTDEAIKIVVIVSHDAKRDWIYVPQQYAGYGEKAAGNDSKRGRYTCPHPLLSFEIKVEAGVERLFIVSITQLVSAFSLQGVGAGFKELARAIQIETAEAEEPAAPAAGDPQGEAEALDVGDGDEEAAEGAGDQGEELPAPLPLQGTPARLAALPQMALADRDYAGDPHGTAEADIVIADLRSHNWYTQNPAVQRFVKVATDPATTDAQRFVLGRNLYQAACGNAWRAADLLPTLGAQEAHYGSGDFAISFAGALFEAYYDPDGHMRAHPKDQMLDALFSLSVRPEFEDVTAWIRERLAPSGPHLILYPGGPRPEAIFQVTLDAEGRAEQVHVAGTLVTEPTQPDEDGWDSEALPAKGTDERMTQIFAKHFGLPASKVRIEPPIADVLNFAKLRLLPWSTDSELVFPAD